MDKKQEIINTAIKILQNSNYQSMKTSLIAAEMGIAEGTIYNYFKSKRELFIETISYLSENLLKFFTDCIDKNKSLRENLEVLGKNFLYNNEYFVNNYKILYKAFSEIDDDLLREKLSIIFNNSIEFIYEKLLELKEIQDLNISIEKVKLIVIILWGIGDISWKRFVISGKNIIEEIGFDIIIEKIFKLIIE